MSDRRVLAPEPPAEGQKVTGPASYFPSIERTYGRPIQEWLDLTTERLDDDEHAHMEVVSWLKSEHGLGHGHANAIVAYVRHARG
ncbi:DUF4287 domain-containing protein [Frigoribacterium sp. RIT-PI-h]|uniref:DUF4287 domain-containing protein n=1 Tax=Frigoribacterium sp. RIT-PI-h TaxID=1690245 RepID=UPI0006B8BB7B|nr:DUF4287 domain-containing protein [Frigoribacterium sp. RIT-PI-h]KPG78896.1 hypothetical protein AEQ27_14415 [Frigoribacterium sp. RIT-PI-h]